MSPACHMIFRDKDVTVTSMSRFFVTGVLLSLGCHGFQNLGLSLSLVCHTSFVTRVSLSLPCHIFSNQAVSLSHVTPVT